MTGTPSMREEWSAKRYSARGWFLFALFFAVFTVFELIVLVVRDTGLWQALGVVAGVFFGGLALLCLVQGARRVGQEAGR